MVQIEHPIHMYTDIEVNRNFIIYIISIYMIFSCFKLFYRHSHLKFPVLNLVFFDERFTFLQDREDQMPYRYWLTTMFLRSPCSCYRSSIASYTLLTKWPIKRKWQVILITFKRWPISLSTLWTLSSSTKSPTVHNHKSLDLHKIHDLWEQDTTFYQANKVTSKSINESLRVV